MENNLEIWEHIFKTTEWGKYPPAALIRFIARNFYRSTDRNSVKILEIGSGPGANLWYLAREDFTVYGIDGSPAACKKAILRLKDEALDHRIGNILAGDYHDKLNNFEDNYFDAIIDIESLYCNDFEKSQSIVKTVFEKLKFNGRFFSMTFAEGSWGMQGKQVGYNAFLSKEGPMANKGLSRYTSKVDIDKLYKLDCNNIVNIERQELHLANDEAIIEWLIEVEKVTK